MAKQMTENRESEEHTLSQNPEANTQMIFDAIRFIVQSHF